MSPTIHPNRSIYDLDRHEWAELLQGEPQYRIEQIWTGLYRQFSTPAELTNLPKKLRETLTEKLPPPLLVSQEQTTDDRKTIKWLFELPDGQQVETVLMRYRTRDTVCVSSQVGCAMGCGFCATGQAGFFRQLTSGEIIEQVARASKRLKLLGGPERVSNVVFMGMGEPMANYEAVTEAITRLNSESNIGARSFTVSTVGIVPGILKLADFPLQVNLAISLHAANNELRSELVPINKTYPIEALMDAVERYLDSTSRRVSFEWAMMESVNDSDADAEQLSELASSVDAHVNLIPLNPTPGWPTRGSSMQRVREFQEVLAENGVNATIRDTRGSDISAACGQLANRTGQVGKGRRNVVVPSASSHISS